MYNVSEYYKIAAKQPVQVHKLDGTIGNVPFDESNIIQGSFHITNQCTANNDVVLGSVYTGTLTATFRDVPISRYAWVGKVITPTFYLKTERSLGVEFWEEVPLGVFTIKEAKHSAEGVSIVAYDNMIKLDKKFKKSNFAEPRKMYGHISQICAKCGIGLAQTEQEIQAMPNGNTELGIVGTKSNTKLKKYSNDIDTYRDLVYWIAQSMACFATVDRNGNLSFRRYRNESAVVDEITEAHRIAGAVFDDFTTNYTGIYVTNTADGEEIYYGYDEQELEQEIATVEGDIQDVEIALDQLAQQYQQGQITEAEYKRQKKVLDKQLKNLDKRLAWLNEALEKAQSEEDGLYMDLGENPMMQADGVGNTPTTMRKRILKALDAISYTPFTCNTVCGVHYDLGDIIRFTGGHAPELGEVCCVMAYDFNMNGEYRMQGFGSDPSKGVIKSKNSKKADKADKNGVSAPTINTGTNTSEAAKEGDLFVTAGGAYFEALDLDNVTASSTSTHPISITDESIDDGAYTIEIKGIPSSWGDGEELHIPLDGLTVGNSYKIEFDGQFTQAQSFTEAGSDCVTVCGTVINLTSDREQHHYSATFTYVNNGEFYFTPYRVSDDNWFTYVFSNLVISNNDSGGKIEVYENNQWRNVKFVRKIFDTLSGGKKIGTVDNSDDTTTDIYIPNMSGASASAAGSNGLVPAPASGDEGKFLRGDGTWQNAGGGGNDVGLSVGSNGAIQSTYTDGTEQTEDILRDDTGEDIVTLLNSIAIALQSAAINVESVNVNYSTDEQVIGTWIDGKPLYQTTLSLTSSSGNDAQEITLSNYGINNIDVVCKIEGTTRATLGYVGLNYFSDNYDKFNLFMKSNNTILVLAHAGDWTHSIPVYVTLQYTKTTD